MIPLIQKWLVSVRFFLFTFLMTMLPPIRAADLPSAATKKSSVRIGAVQARARIIDYKLKDPADAYFNARTKNAESSSPPRLEPSLKIRR